MIHRYHHNLSYLQFPHLSEYAEIRHGIFTRQGGFSKGCYQGLNVGMGSGDDIDHVLRNRAAISGCMEHSELVFADQTHGTTIINLSECGPSGSRLSGDALITDTPGKSLVIQTADCQAVLIYDPVRKAAANIHSGWRGSIQNIIGLTVQAMIKEFNCDPKNLLTGIGPSLGPCCAEFIHYRSEIPKAFWAYKNHMDCFDFWTLSKDQLAEAGIPENHIVSSNLCTRCRTDLFFSYRKEKTTGRFAAVIGIT
ncbi:MAG: peptidoglycan editing factor PgeF [Deltaproteobacteria bacterium]|nr:peptidoglycan editing factor PgeF [Deltaproteobacteria bacterium]